MLKKVEEKMDEIQTIEKKELVLTENASPIMAMKAFLDSGADLDKIEKLLELQERWEATQAKKAYTESMTEFKANPPEIIKDRCVSYDTSKGKTSYNHATLGNVTNQINSSLSKYGLSAAWETKQVEGKITVICKITHRLGHSEFTELSAAPDVSGSKNPIQAIGSTITYLQRYTLLSLTGLATHDQDDDANGADPYEEPKYIDEKKQSAVRDLLAYTESNEGVFLKWLECGSIDTIDEKSYKRAIVNLKAKKEKIDAKDK